MSLARGAPGRIFDRLGTFGVPWHGLFTYVQATPSVGTLTLPNDAQMAYPSPLTRLTNSSTGIERILPLHGRVRQVAFPGIPAVVRTAEEQAADAAAGMEWRTTANIANRFVHGRGFPDDVWIYRDPAGRRWAVYFSAVSGPNKAGTSPLAGRLYFVRFGDFGVPAKTYNRVIALQPADIGQASPNLSSVSDFNLLDDTTWFRLATVYDSLTDGSAAIIGMHWLDGIVAALGGAELQAIYPIGFVECALSGSPEDGTLAVTWTTLATREQTLGAFAHTTDANWVANVYDTITTETQDLYEGGRTEYVTWSYGTLPPGSAGAEVAAGPYSESLTVTGRIVSMRYENGEPVSTSVDFSHSMQSEMTSSFDRGGVRTRMYETGGGGSDVLVSETDTRYQDIIFSISRQMSTKWTLRDNGIEVSAFEHGFTQSGSRDISLTGTSETIDASGTMQWTTTGGFSHQISAPAMGVSRPYGPNGFGADYEVGNSLFTFGNSFGDMDTDLARVVVAMGAPWAAWMGASPTGSAVGKIGWSSTTWCYAPQAVGMVLWSSGSDADVITYGTIKHPAGAVSAVTEAKPASAKPRLYGSWCPATSQFAQDVVPVCWV